jgi:hypothetical protein
MRALAPAAVARRCISARAGTALNAVVVAQRRALLANDKNVDPLGGHALVAARALLTLAGAGDAAPILSHVEALAHNAMLLGNFLFAVSSAAEESAELAATARRSWPEIAARVLDLDASGDRVGDKRSSSGIPLAALLPSAAEEFLYLYREMEGSPIVWWEPLAWRAIVERWVALAAGEAWSVEHLIRFLGALPLEEQLRSGLAWVSALVLAAPDAVARRSTVVSRWLVDTRAIAADLGVLPDWQRVVDALVVAGVSDLAPYSD